MIEKLKPHGIGIDLDGCLFDQLGSIERNAKRIYGLDIKRSDVTKYDLAACTPLTPEQVSGLIKSPSFADGDAIPDAALATRILFDHFVIHIPTARSHVLWKETLDWLRKEKIYYTFLRFISSKEKAEYAWRFELDYFVEDNLETAIAIAEYVSTVFLIDYPYNVGDVPANVIRVSRWKDIIYHIAAAFPIDVARVYR